MNNATPEERVIALAKKWRDADRAFSITKTPADGSKEYRARQELRSAIDKMP